MRLGSAQTGEAERAAIEEIVARGVFYRYHGTTVADFERDFAASVLDGRHTLAVNSGSSALQIAFAALGEKPAFEVLVPVLGFVTAATAVVAAGGVPRFVPVDASLGIDVAAARALVTSRTRAILAVHFQGAACDLTAVRVLADEYGLHVVEDVAQACGGTYRGRALGTHGTVAAFSFQHFKLLSTGEGGLVATADDTIADRALCLHDAVTCWVAPEVTARIDRLTLPPTNLRMSELEGALGLAQLPRLPGWVGRLREIKASLCEYVSRHSALSLRPLPDPEGETATTLAFATEDERLAEQVVDGLRAEGVSASLLLGPSGSNRHFAGDWEPILRQCGLPPVPADIVAATRKLLGSTVVVAIDLRWDDHDVRETLIAFERALPLDGGHQ